MEQAIFTLQALWEKQSEPKVVSAGFPVHAVSAGPGSVYHHPTNSFPDSPGKPTDFLVVHSWSASFHFCGLYRSAFEGGTYPPVLLHQVWKLVSCYLLFHIILYSVCCSVFKCSCHPAKHPSLFQMCFCRFFYIFSSEEPHQLRMIIGLLQLQSLHLLLPELSQMDGLGPITTLNENGQSCLDIMTRQALDILYYQ